MEKIIITIPKPKERGMPVPPSQIHKPKKGKGSYRRKPKHQEREDE